MRGAGINSMMVPSPPLEHICKTLFYDPAHCHHTVTGIYFSEGNDICPKVTVIHLSSINVSADWSMTSTWTYSTSRRLAKIFPSGTTWVQTPSSRWLCSSPTTGTEAEQLDLEKTVMGVGYSQTSHLSWHCIPPGVRLSSGWCKNVHACAILFMLVILVTARLDHVCQLSGQTLDTFQGRDLCVVYSLTSQRRLSWPAVWSVHCWVCWCGRWATMCSRCSTCSVTRLRLEGNITRTSVWQCIKEIKNIFQLSHALHCGLEFTARSVLPVTSSLRGCFAEEEQSSSARPQFRLSGSYLLSVMHLHRWETFFFFFFFFWS